MAAGVNYFGPEKTIHKGFCLATIENLMKDWPWFISCDEEYSKWNSLNTIII